MFNQENRIWWYLLGAAILMGFVLYVGYYYALPVFRGERTLVPDSSYVYNEVPRFDLNVNRDYRARFITSYGTIEVDLYEKRTPENINNLVFLAGRGYYNGTAFHRLIPGLLVQGGDRNTLDDDPSNDGRGSPGYFVRDEVNWDSLGLSPQRRTELTAQGFENNTGVQSAPLQRFSLAMANAGPNTNGSQFFFVLAADSDQRLQQMNGRFIVVGGVVRGSDILQRINSIPVDDSGSNSPRPQQPITLQRIEITSR